MNRLRGITLFVSLILPATAHTKTYREQVREDDGPQRLTRRLGQQLTDEFITPNLPARFTPGGEITVEIFTPAEVKVLRDEIADLKKTDREHEEARRRIEKEREVALQERDSSQTKLIHAPKTHLIWIVLTFTLAPLAIAITILAYRGRWRQLKEDYRKRLEVTRDREKQAEMAYKALANAQASLIRHRGNTLAALRELVAAHQNDATVIFNRYGVPVDILNEPPPVARLEPGRRNTGQG